MSKEIESILEKARVWMSQDPDPETKAELLDALQRSQSGSPHDLELIRQRFTSRLAFGTAGLRGPLGFGPQAMNRIVVSQTTAGLASFLLSRHGTGSTRLRVVVGYDSRKNSEIFAKDTAEVFSGYGFEVLLTPHHVPTPIVAFAVRHSHCDAGVMITASHNPPQDNGYKVYLGGDDEGSQIIPPVDRHIEKAINQVVDSLTFDEIPRSSEGISPTPETLVSTYIVATIDSLSPSLEPRSKLVTVYTPLHGVGADTFLATVSTAGILAPHVVSSQAEPDAAFPTVAFPNPEEPGALDLSFELAKEVNADLILANDPDADRLAVAVPDSLKDSGYRPLTGNQLGAILGWWAAERAHKEGQSGALANSIVSSPVLGKIARYFSLDHQETLTGFKYVSRVPNLIYGFEEALGYLVTPDVVRDKDGISAGLAVLDIAYTLAAEGKTLDEYLATIEEAVGCFASGQVTIRLEEADGKPSLSDLLRKEPPQQIGSRAVVQADDFLEGVDDFPKDNILRYMLEGDARVIVRPSGTEPKLKLYIDATGDTREQAEAVLREIETDLKELIEGLS